MKKVNSTVVMVVLMTLVSFLCLSLSVSYSYIFGSRASKNTQKISTGNLNATINYTPISLNLMPMSDSDGLEQDEYGEVTITKNNQYSIYYSISLSYNLDNMPSDKTISDLVPLEYVKVALFEITDGKLNSSPTVGPVSIGDLPLSEVNDNPAADSYFLASGTFPQGQGNAKYALKVWLSSNISDEYDGKIFRLGIKLKQEPLVSKSIFNIKGKVLLDGNPVYGASLNVQNNLRKTTLLANDNNYNLNNIAQGTYNFSVTLQNGKVYETNIIVKPGDDIGVKTNLQSSGEVNTYIQNAAFSQGTTPYKIIKYNTLTTDSNTLTSGNYLVPSSYEITGKEALGIQEITNVNINLTSSGEISLISG